MVSIRDASRFVIGAAIVRDMASQSSPGMNITFQNVADAAARPGSDGDNLRSSIESLADREASWLRSTPPHTLATDRVMQTRQQETIMLNSVNLAVLMTIEYGKDAWEGDPDASKKLQAGFQKAIRAIDEMPGSTTERRNLHDLFKEQVTQASSNRHYISVALDTAQHAYLDSMMTERLAAYQAKAPAKTDDNDFTP